MRRLVIGNWKMNLTLADATVLAGEVANFASDFATLQIGICPSFVWLVPVREHFRFTPHNFFLGAQAVSSEPHGAYTGDVSAEQLKGLVSHVLVGHSEQRRFRHLSPQDISSQIMQVTQQGMTPVVCFGEPQRSLGNTVATHITTSLSQDLHGISSEVLQKCIFAYEPLWAIGTGAPASPEYIESVVRQVKRWFSDQFSVDVPILYGGSVTAKEAAELKSIEEVGGLLVGGASLHAKEFKDICARFGGHV